jgi:hypothetical protein
MGVAAAFTVLIGVTLWALDQFARHEFSAHLRDQAARALALAASGGTPFDWRFKNVDDIVAGHPFGTQSFEFADGVLRLRPEHETFEIGLPLARSLDLQHFAEVQIAFDAESSGELFLVTRTEPQAPETVSSPVAFLPGSHHEILDLRRVAWSTDKTLVAAQAPAQTAMLRLRFSAHGPGAVSVRQVTLSRPAAFVPLDISATPHIVDAADAGSSSGLVVYRLPFAAAIQQVDIAAISTNPHGDDPPLILLPARGRVEQQMDLRNAVYTALPAAILIPEGAFDETFARARRMTTAGLHATPVSTRWQLVALFGAVLLIARLRPPRNARWRAFIEILLTIAAPMWLIIGGDSAGATWLSPQRVLIGFTVAYAISLSWPRVWHWNGSAQAWLLAAAVVAFALLIALVLHAADGPPAPPGWRHIVRYLGWALLQQYLICAVCAERWRTVTSSTYAAVYLGALGFALLHTPNAALMLATFIGGLCWCAIYLRHRALLPLAFSHAASAVLLSSLLPADILHSAEVSVRFFQ